MKSFALPVAVAAVALLLAESAAAQNGIRYLAMADGKPVTKRVAARKSSARLTSQIVNDNIIDGAYSAGEMTSGGYVGSGDDPVPPNPGVVNYGPWGTGYGYHPDFGIVGNGMSVWPGVPACCDPWLGYCGEPRCNHCSCGRGRYLYVRCNRDTCSPEIVSWGKCRCEGGRLQQLRHVRCLLGQSLFHIVCADAGQHAADHRTIDRAGCRRDTR